MQNPYKNGLYQRAVQWLSRRQDIYVRGLTVSEDNFFEVIYGQGGAWRRWNGSRGNGTVFWNVSSHFWYLNESTFIKRLLARSMCCCLSAQGATSWAAQFASALLLQLIGPIASVVIVRIPILRVSLPLLSLLVIFTSADQHSFPKLHALFKFILCIVFVTSSPTLTSQS